MDNNIEEKDFVLAMFLLFYLFLIANFSILVAHTLFTIVCLLIYSYIVIYTELSDLENMYYAMIFAILGFGNWILYSLIYILGSITGLW